jgi:Fuc2NAc and GlcNAc transferase
MTLVAIAVAFAVTTATTPLVRSAARRLGLLDRPNARSSHAAVTPRSGGLAVLLGLLSATAVIPGLWVGRATLAWLAGALIVAAMGLLDDRFGLPAGPRLAVQAVAAAPVVAATHGFERLPLPAPLDLALGPLAVPLALVWIVGVVNFYNFMDGIDGLAGLQGLVTAAALALALRAEAPAAATVAGTLAAACAGFLIFNWQPASVFLGDAGSGLVGYTLATLPLLVARERRSEAVALTGVSLLLFLADATFCLARRILRGERWYEAHREHLYQRWVRSGAAHAQVSLRLGTAALLITALALVGWERRDAVWTWAALLLGAAAIAGEWALVRRLERRAGSPPKDGRPYGGGSPPKDGQPYGGGFEG